MLTHKANERLPFDVLGHIFTYYPVEETIQYPLETLLLVCKAWSHAALGHRTLWNHLQVYLEHEPVPTIWNARLPLKLARCGPDIPLYIDLRNLFDESPGSEGGLEIDWTLLVPSPSCGGRKATGGYVDYGMCVCHTAVTACIERSLRALMGDKGEMSARWKSLTLYLEKREYGALSSVLSCATPILEHLELGRVWFYEGNAPTPLFPDVRRLKRLSLFDYHLPSLPNCDNLLDVNLEWEVPLRIYPDLSALRSASQLQALSILSSFNAQIPLPAQLHNLRVLKVNGEAGIRNSGLSTCQMPLLSHLSLDYQYTHLLNAVLLCKGLPVEKLTRVTLTWMQQILYETDELTSVMELSKPGQP